MKLQELSINFPWHVELHVVYRAGVKPRSDCLEQVNFVLGRLKMEVWGFNGLVKLASAQ